MLIKLVPGRGVLSVVAVPSRYRSFSPVMLEDLTPNPEEPVLRDGLGSVDEDMECPLGVPKAVRVDGGNADRECPMFPLMSSITSLFSSLSRY
jgi:hypothetical protein